MTAVAMLRVGIVIVSSKVYDEREPDKGREELGRLVEALPGTMVSYSVVPDDRESIRNRLASLCDDQAPDVVLTVGGTGVRPTDWAPEATRDVVEKEIPGIGEAMRVESLKKVQTAMLSRGTAGIRGSTLVVNLPGSPRGARENLAVLAPILEHTVQKITKNRDT